MNEKASIAKQAATTFGAKTIGFFFTFIGSVFLTRLLGVEGKGVQAFINTNVVLFSTFFGLNIMTTLTYYIAKENFDAAAARGFALLLNLGGIFIFTAGIALLFVFESPILNFIIPEGYQSTFFVMYLIGFFLNGIVTPFFNGNWTGQAKFRIINSLFLLSSVLNAVTYGVVWVLHEKDIVLLSLEETLGISLLVTLVVFLARVIVFIRSREEISFKVGKVARPILVFSSIGWLTGVLNFGNRRIDIWFVEYYRGIEQLGYYALASNLVEVFISLFLPATYVLSPYLTNASMEEQEVLLGRFSRILAAIVVVVTIIALPLMGPVLPLLYGDEFIGTVLPLKILWFGGALLLIGNVFFTFNVATNNLRPNLLAIFASLLVTLLLDYLLVPNYGLVGASFASVAAYGVSTLLLVFSVVNKFTKPFHYFLFFRKEDYEYLAVKYKSLFQD